jgi:hypothetical protein
MSVSSEVRLLCIVIDDNLKVRDSSFIVSVSSDTDLGGVIGCVVEITPSLRSVDHRKFKLYQPPQNNCIVDSHSLDGAQLTQEHLANPLFVSFKVNEIFREKSPEHRLHIDVIVCVTFGEQGACYHLLVCNQAPDLPAGSEVALRPLPTRSHNSYLPYVTFQLDAAGQLQLPPDAALRANNVTEFEGRELPDFVQELEQELCLQRSPHCNVSLTV